MRAALLLLFIALLAGGAPEARADLADHIEIRVPDGAAGPVPVVLLFAGCGGVRQVQSDYAETALEAGWAAMIVDSHSARGIDRTEARLLVCTALAMRGDERARDVLEAVELAREDPRLNSDQIAVVGWSHGGWTVLDAFAIAASDEVSDTALAGVRTAYLLYPYCGRLSRAFRHPILATIPTTIVIAGKDRVVSADQCRRLADRQNASGADLIVIEEPELTHAFDAPDQPFDPRMRYDPDGADRSRSRLAALLAGLDN